MVKSGVDLGAREDAGEEVEGDDELPAVATEGKEDGEAKKGAPRGATRGKPAPKKAPTVQVKKAPGKAKKGDE